MKTLNKTVVALATGTISTLMIAGGANATSETKVLAAQISSDENIEYVSYADLNIGSEAGMATLLGRIERAANEVCGSTNYRLAGGLNQASLNAQCKEEAIAAALSQLPDNTVASRD
ncbi:MAG: UrcA family protein [Pseudomonadota bacterium]